ncbi:MAG: PA2779 family protein [Desulfobacteraceae bacterium]|nr:PA2779 family protein [Desulfobacteraceae bacterium]
MRRTLALQKSVAIALAFVFCYMSVFIAPANATMVRTADILQKHDNNINREKVISFMQRQDVAAQFKSWGVEPEEAQMRVMVMSDEEISMLAKKIDELPAGGDAIGFILTVGIVVFVVLLITDIVGVTDVFTFIKKR